MFLLGCNKQKRCHFIEKVGTICASPSGNSALLCVYAKQRFFFADSTRMSLQNPLGLNFSKYSCSINKGDIINSLQSRVLNQFLFLKAFLLCNQRGTEGHWLGSSTDATDLKSETRCLINLVSSSKLI